MIRGTGHTGIRGITAHGTTRGTGEGPTATTITIIPTIADGTEAGAPDSAARDIYTEATAGMYITAQDFRQEAVSEHHLQEFPGQAPQHRRQEVR